MDFVRKRTAKLRSFVNKFTRRASNRIAPASGEIAPASGEVAPRQASSSSRQASSSSRQASSSSRQASSRLRRLRRLTRQASLSPRQASLSPRTKTLKRIRATTAARKLQKTFRRAAANPNLEECAICSGAMMQPKLTKTLICGHKFHRKCIDKWTALKPSCPNCRAYIAPENTNNVNRVYALIERMRNAATMIEAINLLNESEVLIHSLPHNEREVLREARTPVWLQTYALLQAQATIDAINHANTLIASMRNATTFDQASGLYDEITSIIDRLPRNDDYRRLANLQWNAWSHVYGRLAAPIQRRAPITVNGTTTVSYNRSRQLDTHPVNGITSDEYDRLIRGMY